MAIIVDSSSIDLSLFCRGFDFMIKTFQFKNVYNHGAHTYTIDGICMVPLCRVASDQAECTAPLDTFERHSFMNSLNGKGGATQIQDTIWECIKKPILKRKKKLLERHRIPIGQREEHCGRRNAQGKIMVNHKKSVRQQIIFRIRGKPEHNSMNGRYFNTLIMFQCVNQHIPMVVGELYQNSFIKKGCP